MNDMEKAVQNYESHFHEKAPPMGALMSLPGVFAKYINLLNDAVSSNKKIQWDKTIDWDNPDFNY